VRGTLVAFTFALGLLAGPARATPPACLGQGDAGLAVSILDLGGPATVTVTGRPDAPFALLADRRGGGPTPTRIGTVCLDLGPGLKFLHDSLKGDDAPLDASGTFEFSGIVPPNPGLLGRTVYFQAVVKDLTAPNHFAISRGEARTVGNGSRGDYRLESLELPMWGEEITLDAEFGDVDGDGDLDLFLANAPVGQNQLLINDGTGHFTDGTQGGTTGLPLAQTFTTGAKFADIDGDGDLDLATLGNIEGQILVNDGNGLFTEKPNALVIPFFLDYFDAEFADVDGDGDLDLLMGSQAGWSNMMMNDGTGTFTDDPLRLSGNESRALDTEFGDVDLDGDVDFVLVYADDQPRLFLNDGFGYFTDGTFGGTTGFPPYARSEMSGRDIELGDVDGDGDLDAVIVLNVLFDDNGGSLGPGRNKLFENDGHGLFTEVTAGTTMGLPEIYDLSEAAEFADVDRDGDLDIFIANSGLGDFNYLLLNDGHGKFTLPAAGDPTGFPEFAELNPDVELADVDGDGDPDLVLTVDLSPTRHNRLYFNH